MMRVFVTSDLHVDFPSNETWVESLSRSDYVDDVLLVAGDVSDSLPRLARCMEALTKRFRHVLFVPGNHDLWVHRDPLAGTSLEKFERVREMVRGFGVSMEPVHVGALSVVPMLGWYDDSFGAVSDELRAVWMDFIACRWPAGWTHVDAASHFCAMNEAWLSVRNDTVISFSHFLPRIDLIPSQIPQRFKILHPVLGTGELERQIRRLKPAVHVYGHSHINRDLAIDGIRYVNNAFAYPYEQHIAAKRLKCVYEGNT